MSEVELPRPQGIGSKAIQIISKAMTNRGLAFSRSEELISISDGSKQSIKRRTPKRNS